jgi:hypothetical protein
MQSTTRQRAALGAFVGGALLASMLLAAGSAPARPTEATAASGRLLTSLTAPRPQSMLDRARLVGVVVYPTCQDPCSLKALGTVRVLGRTYALKAASPAQIAGLRSLTLKVNATLKAQKRLKDDLRRRGTRGTATVEVTATAADGYSERMKVTTTVTGG